MQNSSGNTHSSGNNPPPMIISNPFQKSGSESMFEVTETKEACVMRVDMPGCPESDLAYWIDSNNIHFFADEPPKYQQHSGRRYGGSIVINPETYDVKEAKAKLFNGVLWITVPKIPGSNANIHVIQ